VVDAQAGQEMTALLGEVARDEPAHEQRQHHRVQHPALPGASGHPAEGGAERRREHGDGQHREEIRERCGILVRMGAVHVEEAAAVAAEVLDRLERGHRAQGDELLGRPAPPCRPAR
jgi:hypothetical protein